MTTEELPGATGAQRSIRQPASSDREGSLPIPTHGWAVAQRGRERGMVTAEWAIGVIAAVSLAGLLLLFVLKGGAKELITGIVLKIVKHVAAWGGV